MSDMKVIEIQVSVINADEDEKWEVDTDYPPERICLTYEDPEEVGGVEFIYAEAEEIKAAIQRLITS